MIISVLLHGMEILDDYSLVVSDVGMFRTCYGFSFLRFNFHQVMMGLLC